ERHRESCWSDCAVRHWTHCLADRQLHGGVFVVIRYSANRGVLLPVCGARSGAGSVGRLARFSLTRVHPANFRSAMIPPAPPVLALLPAIRQILAGPVFPPQSTPEIGALQSS